MRRTEYEAGGRLGRFPVSDSNDGCHTVILEDYEQFAELFNRFHFRDYPEYVFRGHRDPSWPLLPSLYREIQRKFFAVPSEVSLDILKMREKAGIETALMLKRFLFGLRGTQWQDPGQELIIQWFDENSDHEHGPHIKDLREADKRMPGLWSSVLNTWATAQHYGLWTPLLDWSESMLIAFYFAFEQPDERATGEENRVVFALNRRLIEERCRIKDFEQPHLDFVTPFTRNNPRLIAQKGLFTYSHVYQSVEEWVREVFYKEDLPVLIKILIRNVTADQAVRWLNRAGVSDVTIYPDLTGISKFAKRAFDDHDLCYI